MANSTFLDGEEGSILKLIQSQYRVFDDLPKLLGIFLKLSLSVVGSKEGILALFDPTPFGEMKTRARVYVNNYRTEERIAGNQPVGEERLMEAALELLRSQKRCGDTSPGNELRYIGLSSREKLYVVVPIAYQRQTIGAITLTCDGGAFRSARNDRALKIISREAAYHIKRFDLGTGSNDCGGQEIRIVGISEALRRMDRAIEGASLSNRPVLINGETGVGKELVAHAIHLNSPRKEGPFIAVNCGALVDELAASELFGHAKGAFTGAIYNHQGKFIQAHRGTIFLDEICEASQKFQCLLLRTFDQGEIQKVGGNRPNEKVNVRIIAATNRDIESMLKDGTFRSDLYYRLNVIRIQVPPLRERKEDIKYLVEYFVRKHSYIPGQRASPEIIRLFEAYDWPGNVRELENVVSCLIAFANKDTIDVDDLEHYMPDLAKRIAANNEKSQLHDAFTGNGLSLRERIKMLEKQYILKALEENRWSVTSAARELKLSQPNLSKKMKKYGISKPKRDN